MKLALSLIPYYVSWHYTHGIKNLFNIWVNFIHFSFNFFSIKELLRTLFSPFERLQEQYKEGFDPEDFFATLVTNIMMRIVGFFVRTFTILLGLIFTTGVILIGVSLLLLWILLPLLLIYVLVLALKPILNI